MVPGTGFDDHLDSENEKRKIEKDDNDFCGLKSGYLEIKLGSK